MIRKILLGATCVAIQCAFAQTYTFSDDELELKITYDCAPKKGMAAPKARAKKAHAYYVKRARVIGEALVDAMVEGKSSADATAQFARDTADLGKAIPKKFSCSVVKAVDL